MSVTFYISRVISVPFVTKRLCFMKDKLLEVYLKSCKNERKMGFLTMFLLVYLNIPALP